MRRRVQNRTETYTSDAGKYVIYDVKTDEGIRNIGDIPINGTEMNETTSYNYYLMVSNDYGKTFTRMDVPEVDKGRTKLEITPSGLFIYAPVVGGNVSGTSLDMIKVIDCNNPQAPPTTVYAPNNKNIVYIMHSSTIGVVFCLVDGVRYRELYSIYPHDISMYGWTPVVTGSEINRYQPKNSTFNPSNFVVFKDSITHNLFYVAMVAFDSIQVVFIAIKYEIMSGGGRSYRVQGITNKLTVRNPTGWSIDKIKQYTGRGRCRLVVLEEPQSNEYKKQYSIFICPMYMREHNASPMPHFGDVICRFGISDDNMESYFILDTTHINHDSMIPPFLYRSYSTVVNQSDNAISYPNYSFDPVSRKRLFISATTHDPNNPIQALSLWNIPTYQGSYLNNISKTDTLVLGGHLNYGGKLYRYWNSSTHEIENPLISYITSTDDGKFIYYILRNVVQTYLPNNITYPVNDSNSPFYKMVYAHEIGRVMTTGVNSDINSFIQNKTISKTPPYKHYTNAKTYEKAPGIVYADSYLKHINEPTFIAINKS